MRRNENEKNKIIISRRELAIARQKAKFLERLSTAARQKPTAARAIYSEIDLSNHTKNARLEARKLAQQHQHLLKGK